MFKNDGLVKCPIYVVVDLKLRFAVPPVAVHFNLSSNIEE